MKRTREERFSEKVAQPGCLIWCGARNAWGYGTFSWEPHHNINASRAAWMLTHGAIPDGMDVCHRCNNRLCVNVEHMYLGTDKQNYQDRLSAGTDVRGEKAWNTNLTNAQAKEIKARFKKHRYNRSNAKELAQEYGVTAAVICSIGRGDTWRHIDEEIAA